MSLKAQTSVESREELLVHDVHTPFQHHEFPYLPVLRVKVLQRISKRQ